MTDVVLFEELDGTISRAPAAGFMSRRTEAAVYAARMVDRRHKS